MVTYMHTYSMAPYSYTEVTSTGDDAHYIATAILS